MIDIRVLIVDPLPLVRKGIATVLSAEPNFVVIGEAEDAVHAVHKAERLHPEIILSELDLPGGHIEHICAAISSKGLASRVVALSVDCTGESVSKAVSAGVAGYLSKFESTDKICDALKRVSSGQPVFSDEAQAAIQLFLQLQSRSPDELDISLPHRPLLTDKEVQVLQCIAQGMSTEETARRLNASVSTIKNHRQSIFVKLNVPNAPGAVYEAMHRGILQ